MQNAKLGLRRVAELVRAHRPDIVVGDFNAPRRSRVLSVLGDEYRHAYDVAGSGWSYTWPLPFPVYAIDQCIAGPRVEIVDYRIRSSVLSDHRRQVLDFVLPGN
jgi:endonuclease/exonuclease/phosphatase (EEP) superfamily protein YafD